MATALRKMRIRINFSFPCHTSPFSFSFQFARRSHSAQFASHVSRVSHKFLWFWRICCAIWSVWAHAVHTHTPKVHGARCTDYGAFSWDGEAKISGCLCTLRFKLALKSRIYKIRVTHRHWSAAWRECETRTSKMEKRDGFLIYLRQHAM